MPVCGRPVPSTCCPYRRGSVPWLSAVAAGLLATGLAAASVERRPEEVRALWVVRQTLTAPALVLRMVEQAEVAGFNTLLLQVRGRGDAYYTSGLEPRAAALATAPAGFDPLALALQEGHRRGLRVLAWINVNLVASAAELPADPRHLVNHSPEWLMVPRALAQTLAHMPPTSPAYVGRLARWTRERDDVEGLYASPLVPAAVGHLEAVTADLVTRYAVDGVHFDYARFPNAEFDHSRAALDAFRDRAGSRLPASDRQRLDEAYRSDVLAYVDALPDDWSDFRRAALTAAVRRLADVVRRARPGALVTAAVIAEQQQARRERLQDWPRWVAAGLFDAVCPMAYTPDDVVFSEQVASAVATSPATDVWAGIGAYRLSPDQTVARIETARRLGARGVVLFSYDSMAAAGGTPGYLASVARGAFGTSAVDSH